MYYAQEILSKVKLRGMTFCIIHQADQDSFLSCPQDGALPDVRHNCTTVDGVDTAVNPISWKEIRSW